MSEKRGNKQEKEIQASESSGQAQTTAHIDHAFVSRDHPKKVLHGFKKLTGKFGLTIGIVVILLVGGIFALRYFSQKHETDKQNQAFQTLMSGVKNLRNEGKDGEAQAKLFQFNRKYPNQTKDQRYLLANELAAIYKTAGDYKNAVKWQQAAVDNSPHPAYGDYLTLGEAYALNNNNAQAVKYLQLALDELKEGDASSDGGPEGRFIQYEIEKLRGEKQ